jgi:NAD(P)-dependent dehydrogenase (short-subunit alcohol dehydrogenase family)
MNGKRMIITGASKGIGRGLAAYFCGPWSKDRRGCPES